MTLIFLIAMILAFGCATMANLPGGPKDETPPQIDKEKTSANFQTQFSDREITITLDEWVKLDDPINRILISPPLEKRADIDLKGKSVIVKFDDEEVLRENATYTINFGESILDITEGNSLDNYAFVFSTGDQIDSLSIHGKIIDAFTSEEMEDITVMVYESQEDSIVFKEKPFYATRSRKDGTFQINNMKEGHFKLVAIKDENLNYLYDPVSEALGSLTFPIKVSADSMAPYQIRMSTEAADPYIDRRDTNEWNLAQFTYNRIPYEIDISYHEPDGTLFIDRKEKNINVWADPSARSSWQIYFMDTLRNETDTFTLRRNVRKKDQVANIGRLTRIAPSGHPDDPFYFCFDRPIRKIDTSFMVSLAADSSRAILPATVSIDSLPLCLRFEQKWQPDSTYRLTLLPGAITDYFGLTNDTLELSIPIGNVERFGNIELHISGLDSAHAYIIDLMLKEKEQLSFKVKNSTTFSKMLTKLKPGTYQLRITEDSNRNGRWDPINYLKGSPPEKIITTDIEQLRANWDVEVNYKWSES